MGSMISPEVLAQVATDIELIQLLDAHADHDDTVGAILAELDRRDAEMFEVDEQTRLVDLVRAERRAGETLEQTVDRMYGDHTCIRYIQAEDYANGHLLNKAGQEAKVDPYTLFYGPAARAVDYASRELRDWWRDNGRITWIEYMAMMLGRPSDIKKAREVRRRANDLGL